MIGEDDVKRGLGSLRPSEDGSTVYVGHSPSSQYKWNALLGAWVKVSGEGPNFVVPNRPPEEDHGDHHD
jgi:hypothetical protein